LTNEPAQLPQERDGFVLVRVAADAPEYREADHSPKHQDVTFSISRHMVAHCIA